MKDGIEVVDVMTAIHLVANKINAMADTNMSKYKLALAIFFLIATHAYGQVAPRTAKTAAEFVPPGYVVVEKIQGDLNKDHQTDDVLIIKATDKNNFVKHEYRGLLDRNRRGILIALKKGDRYELALENRDCFSSENEDGGVYFPPEVSVFVEKGNLRIHYAHGRYGSWTYTFRHQNADFELIGFDSSENHGPVVDRSVSINFLTQKMLIRDNVNPAAVRVSKQDKFKETSKTFVFAPLIQLRSISDFDPLDVESLLGSAK